MTTGTVTISVATELGKGDRTIQMCSCSLCMAAAANGSAVPHPMAEAIASGASGTRGAALLDQYQGSDGFYHYSGDRNIDAVLIGSKWTGTNLTFSFPSSAAPYGESYDNGQALKHVSFNAAQQTATRDAFRLVASYTGLTFTELAPDSTERPTFRLSSSAMSSVGSAMGYFPKTIDDLGGDIWFGRTQQPYYETPTKGNWGYVTILHEIGHTLGLKHGHSDYTGDDLSSFFGTDKPFYGSRALEYDRDGQAWSVMTYTPAPDSSTAFNGDSQNQAQTYMMYDIAALQYMYGANYTTNAGDSVYKWNPLTGEMSINGVGQGAPAGNKVLGTIWDGGGNDTYDFSNYDGDMAVDLRPGQLSTISTAQLANSLAYSDSGTILMAGNIGNALLFKGDTASLIENAIGGAGNDTMVGNQANNRLEGGAGNDMLAGGTGSDMLIGGDGNDIADFSDATTGINVTLNNGAADIIVANGNDRDVLRSIEGVIGTAFTDNLIGDRGDNVLWGGSGGRDYLNGGDGNDTLIGATDTVIYTDLPDIIKTADQFIGSMDSAIALDGSFDLAANVLVEQSQTLPHATVRAEGIKGETDYYRFTATAGSAGIFDIDGALPKLISLDLLDADGNVLATSRGGSLTDAGSRSGGSPLINFTFQATGTYYLRVGGANLFGESLPLSTDDPYILNVSVEGQKVDSTVTATGSGRFYGGAGDDLIIASTGDDLISGGTGIDTLSYANARSRVTIDLSLTAAQQTTGAGKDTIGGIENLIGSRFGDTLRGDAGDNVINGGGGSDRLFGGAGTDTLSFAGQNKAVTYSLAQQGVAQAAQLGATIMATGFENLEGGAGADRLTGDEKANVIRGGAGADTLSGSAGNTYDAADTLDGGAGFDTASFAGRTDGVIATMFGGGRGLVYGTNGALLANLAGIEAVTGGSGDDVLIGDGDANTLNGGDGADRLIGGGGGDALDGGLGDDVIDGGAGVNTAVFNSINGNTVDLAIGGAQDTGAGRDTLIGIANLRSGAGDDALFGDDRANVFTEGGGNDLYVGRGGSDTVDYSAATATLRVDLSETGQQDTRASGADLLDGIENLIGGSGENVLLGNSFNNRLVGNARTDALIGGLGDDTLEGGDGDDFLVGDGTFDNPDGITTNDTLIGGRGADTLIGGAGDDLLIGGSGNDTLISGDANLTNYDTFYSIDSLVRKDGGRDTIDGGDGDDYAVVYYIDRQESIRLDMRNTQATNNVYFDGVAHGSITGVETISIVGGNADDWFATGAGYDSLQGGAGNDYLSSGLGDDVVQGGAGDDWMDGGEGYDTVSYSLATGGITLDLARSDAQDTGGAGIDTILNFENARLGAFSDTVHGTDGGNRIIDEAGGNDRFFGLGGDDELIVARQNTDTTSSTILIDGGDGSDFLQYASIPTFDRFIPISFYRQLDTVTLIGGEGNDTILMSGQKNGVIDAGAGDDIVHIGIGGVIDTGLDITLGAGSDRVKITWYDNYFDSIDRKGNVIRDFQTGDGGDRFDLTNALPGSWKSLNPFSIAQLKLVQVGDDVLLQGDRDGAGTEYEAMTFMTFLNVKATDFTGHNFYYVTGDGVFVPFEEHPLDPFGPRPDGETWMPPTVGETTSSVDAAVFATTADTSATLHPINQNSLHLTDVHMLIA